MPPGDHVPSMNAPEDINSRIRIESPCPNIKCSCLKRSFIGFKKKGAGRSERDAMIAAWIAATIAGKPSLKSIIAANA